MLDLRRLRLLSELSRRDTIAEVARVVGYTPSAVSQALAQLERETGVALLERDGRRVRLTPAAHALVARTDRALGELDAAEAELAAEQEAVRGSVAIGAFPSAAAMVAAPAVALLRERHAELACSVLEHEPEDGIQLLRSGDLDVLVSESYDDVEPAATGGLDEHLLVVEPLLLVVPPRARSSRLADLSDADWIGGLAGTQFAAALERACRRAGFVPRVAHRADDALLIQALVGAGLGVALLPALACAGSDAVRFVAADPEPPRRHVTALVRRGADRRPGVAAALAALRERAQSVEARTSARSRTRSAIK
jgi:DNA-binding transcriptional LysR family regulator